MIPTKKTIFLIIIKGKQRYIRTSLPCNVTVVDLYSGTVY
jgi:hypothetical protein